MDQTAQDMRRSMQNKWVLNLKIKFHRRFIGFEIQKDYYLLANKRIEKVSFKKAIKQSKEQILDFMKTRFK